MVERSVEARCVTSSNLVISTNNPWSFLMNPQLKFLEWITKMIDEGWQFDFGSLYMFTNGDAYISPEEAERLFFWWLLKDGVIPTNESLILCLRNSK